MIEGKLSIVMPAYNEAEYIEKNLIETIATMNSFGYDYEIIVVDDGSPDHTHLAAASLLQEHPRAVRIVRYDKNRGKGNALMCGVGYATGDYVVFLDADMDLHPSQLPTFFEIMMTQDADVVIGSKRHPLSNVNYPLLRRLYSTVYYGIVQLLFGLPLRDTQTGLKVFRRAVLERVFPMILIKRFAFDLEVLLLAARLGYKIVDAPVTLEFQRGFSRIRIRDIIAMLLDTASIFYRMKLLRYYDQLRDVPLQQLTASHGSREVERSTSPAER